MGMPISPTVADEIERTDGVQNVTRLRYAVGELDGQGQGVNAVDPSDLERVVRIQMTHGSVGDLSDDGILVAADVAGREGIEMGDTIRYTMPAGEREYDVVGIYEDNPVLSYPYTVTLGAFADAGFQPADNYLLVNREAGADQVALQADVEELTRDLPTVTVKDQEGFAAEQRAPIDQMLMMIYALLGLAVVIAVLGIVNTLALSVIERTRELGLLRAVGLDRRQLRRMVRLESVVIALLGAVLGTVMGMVFGTALVLTLETDGLSALVLPWRQIGGFVVASALVGVLAAAFPARRAARLDVLRASATE
jgi:putative ABC transport system permease protein